MNDEKIISGHEYDGIRELDNDLPPWWLMLFFLTTVFALGYMVVYHVYITENTMLRELGDENKVWSGKSDQSSGHGLYVAKCMACHGEKADGIREVMAPQLAGQEDWYVAQQLHNFMKGSRGYHPSDTGGLTMKSIAQTSIKSDAEITAIASYLHALTPVKQVSGLGGDPEKGRALFALCQSCHGDKAQGNAALHAPALRHLNDWYFKKQLMNFKSGVRGSHDGDTWGKTMSPMAQTLTDEQAMADVYAYILTL